MKREKGKKSTKTNLLFLGILKKEKKISWNFQIGDQITPTEEKSLYKVIYLYKNVGHTWGGG